MSKCEFIIYKGVSEHKCTQKKGKYHTFYVQGGALKTDQLKIVAEPKRYTKCRIRVQRDCNCEKTVRLSIVNQLARSIHFNPNTVYNYTDKIVITTDFGFTFWLFEQTRKIRSQSPLVDSFVGALMPGTTFYDGTYMSKVVDSIGEILPLPEPYSQCGFKHDDHRRNLLEIRRICGDLSSDSFVVNKIILSRQDL